MAIHHSRSQRRLTLLSRWLRHLTMALRLEKWVVVKEVIATLILGYLAWQGTSPGMAVFFIGVINTVSIAELYKAYRSVQATNRDDLTSD